MPRETESNVPRSDLPEGTVTFLFTDIEGSTELLKQLKDQYASLLADQRRVLRDIFTRWNGQEVDTQGDAFFYSFPRATEAVSAAVEAQRVISAHTWPADVEVRVRMGLHTGEPSTWEEGYVGIDVHRSARIAHVGYGGQVLLSDTTASLIRDEQTEGISLLELGKYRLKGIPRPEQIYQLEIEGLVSEFPPLKAADAGLPPHNLPPQPTPFVGRAPELEALDEMIADPSVRLISIVAAGGMGKTRLALAVSEQQLFITERTNGRLEARFPQGVYFVPLASLDSPRSIVPAIAEALNFMIDSGQGKDLGGGEETRSPKRQLLDYLRYKRLLLIMDNFEHLLEGASLLSEIIGSAPEVQILVTSRERLHLKGEYLFPLLGMKFPDLDKINISAEMDHEAFSALALFLQSAQCIQPGFTITDEDLVDVTSICRLVGGMPLGIELAASWVNMLTVNEIANEIQRSLDFLETRLRDIDVRHRSMRAVFDSTWDRLSNTERDLLERLTVFRGGFTREAAQEVAAASLNLLRALTTKSLLQFDHVRGTYEMHELIRMFGSERLAQDSEKEKTVRDEHSTYYCHLLCQLEKSLKGSRHMEAMAEVEADFENITTAWKWAVEQGQLKLISSVLEAMNVYYEYSGRWEEGEEAFRYAADKLLASQSVEELRLHVRLNNLVAIYIPENRMDRKKKLLETNWELLKTSALAQEDTRFEEATLLTIIGYTQKDSMQACRHFQQAYELFRSLDDSWGMAMSLGKIGDCAQDFADTEEAIEYTQMSLAMFKELGFRKGIATRLNRLSALETHNLNFGSAGQYLQESMEISEQLDDRRTLGWTLLFIGYLKIIRGLFEDAAEVFNVSFDINKELGLTFRTIYADIILAQIDSHLGRYQDALDRARKAQRDAETENFQVWIAVSLAQQGDALQGEGEHIKAGELYQESIKIRRSYGLTAFIPTIFANWSVCMYGVGNYLEMRDLMLEALQINAMGCKPLTNLYTFPALALLQLVEGEVEKAIEYYAYAASYAYVANSQWYYDLVGRHIEKAAESLPPEVVAAAQVRGRELDPYEVTAELLHKL